VIGCVYIKDKRVLTSSTYGYTMSVYQTQQFNNHPLLLHCVSITETKVSIIHCWLQCFRIWETTVFLRYCWLQYVGVSETTGLSSPTFANICQYIRHNSLYFTQCWLHWVIISDNIFILIDCLLLCVCILETKLFFSKPVVYILSVYKTQQLCSYTLWVTIYQFIWRSRFIITHCY